MYNRYLASSAAAPQQQPPVHTSPPAAEPEPPQQHAGGQTPPGSASVFSGIPRLLTGRLQNIKLDMDTILVLVVVWFLLSDGEDLDWDLLLMIGALLILGI